MSTLRLGVWETSSAMFLEKLELWVLIISSQPEEEVVFYKILSKEVLPAPDHGILG